MKEQNMIERLLDLMDRAMEINGMLYYAFSKLLKEVYKAGGVATDEQHETIAKQENILINLEKEAEPAAQINVAAASAASAASSDETKVDMIPNPPSLIKRVAVNEKAQKSFEILGAAISAEVNNLIQGQGIGSMQEFNRYVGFFCNSAKKHATQINKNEVFPPKSMEVLINLYHLDYNAQASQLFSDLCSKLQGGIPHIEDHF